MAVSTQPYKGARDFYPEDKRLQKWLFNKWRDACEKFGYEEYDAPILEPTDLFLMKGSDEIVSDQTYTFVDRGNRSVTIRTEMTPSVSRMVAGRRQELAYPLRWYSIPNLWRYERTQRGRLREFWQLNVDIFGVQTIEAEHEVILLADQLLKSVGAKRRMYKIHINSRRLTDYVLGSYFQLDEVEVGTVRRLIDKMHKMPRGEFEANLEASISPSQREEVVSGILAYLQLESLEDLPVEIKNNASAREISGLMALLDQSGLHNAVFDPTLMRGFDYYTDVVFEVFDTDPENNRAMFGGGRYDGLVGMFGVDPVPTVGFGMGDVTFVNFLEKHDLLPQLHSDTELYAVIMDGLYPKAQHLISELREMGVKVAVDSTERKIDKKIKAADKKGIRYLAVIGQEEIESGQLTVRDMQTGEETKHSLQRLVSFVKDFRREPEV